MKRLWNRIPRGLRLALNLLAILILLLSAWAMLDYPLWSPEAAFRSSLEDAGYPALDPELLVDTERGLQCLASDGNYVYRSTVQWERFGWRGTYQQRCPQAEGVPYIAFEWFFGYGEATVYDEELEASVPRILPLFAVKTEAAAASLRLTLGEGHTPRYNPHGPESPPALLERGSFPLQRLETKNGWSVFGFNLAVMEPYSIPTIPVGEMRNDYDHFNPPYDILALWMAMYSPSADFETGGMEPESRLELTLFDEAMQVIRTVELPTHYRQ